MPQTVPKTVPKTVPQTVPHTVVLSDLHLGRPGGASRGAAFERIIGACERLIINGDAAELHHARFQHDAQRELDVLRDRCATRGVRLDFIAGNHDPFISEDRAMTLADGAIYITHGDAFHHSVAPWSPYAASMRATFEATLAATPPGTPEDCALFHAAREAAISEWRVMGSGAHVSTIGTMAVRPHRVLCVLAYWSQYSKLAAQWAARFSPRAGTVIVGHSHRASISRLNGRTVVNTGAYGFPGVPHAIVIEGSTIKMCRIELAGAYYEIAAKPRSEWKISHARGAANGARVSANDAGAQSPPTGFASAATMKRAATPNASPSSDTL